MQNAIQDIASANGLDATTAQKAVGLILAFLKKEADPEAVGKLMASMPGAESLVAGAGEAKGGMMGSMMGMMGGGVMALGSQLMGAGLSMGQIQGVSKQLFAIGRDKAGEDVMGAIVGSVPGLAQFV